MPRTILNNIMTDEQRQKMIDIVRNEDASKKLISFYDTILFVNNELLENMYNDQVVDQDWEKYAPIGLIQMFQPRYTRQRGGFGEIGSSASGTSVSKASKVISIQRILHFEQSMLKALYRGSLKDNDTFNNNRILTDCAMPMFDKPFIIRKLIFERDVREMFEEDQAMTPKSDIIYHGCCVSQLNGGFQAAQNMSAEGATIQWTDTENLSID